MVFLRTAQSRFLCCKASCLYICDFICGVRSVLIYSSLSLSRPLLSRITAYLEVDIWSLLKHENLTTGKKILWKRAEIAPRSNLTSFAQYFQYISNFKSPFFCVEVLRSSQPYGVMSSAVSLPNHTFTGQA